MSSVLMPPHTFNYSNRALSGYALSVATQLPTIGWPLMSKLWLLVSKFPILLMPSRYVREILDSTSKSVEQIDIQPDGQWKAHGPVEEQQVKPEPQYDAYNLDDDDLVISEVNFSGGRDTSTPGEYRSTHTPANLVPQTGAPTPASGASREGSSMPRSGGNKRSHDVIDLTLSDDDDAEPLPPSKRQQFNRLGAGYPPFY